MPDDEVNQPTPVRKTAAREQDVLPAPVIARPPSSRAATWTRTLMPGLAVAGGLGGLEVLRRRFQHSQLFLPERYPNGIWNPAPYGVEVEDVWFQAEDGIRLHGWWIPLRKARGTVLYCHGNSGNITSRIGVFRYLQRLKLNILAFDYRGYGRSEGEPSEKGLFADVRAAHHLLTEELGQDPSRLIVFGHSLGGAVAIDCVASRPAAGLVVQSTFTNLREMARARFPSFPLHLVASHRFRSVDKVAALELPKLFIHGTADETVPFRLGRRLYESAADPKEWYPVPHAGHNDVYRYGGLRYMRRVSRFVRGALRDR